MLSKVFFFLQFYTGTALIKNKLLRSTQRKTASKVRDKNKKNFGMQLKNML